MLSKGALNGITVLDLSRMLPGPFCSMILADHGARVVAIEDRKQFEKDGLFLPTVQRNKTHISLDLKSDADLRLFGRMIKDADVLIEGFRPGVARRLGVDYDAVRRIKDDIIYCSITAYGQTGPYSNRPGHDVNCLAYAGVLDLMGDTRHPPAIPGIQIADMAGAMNGVIGILLALFERQRSGQGQHIDISMTDSALSLLPVAQYARELTGQLPLRGDNMLSHRYACYNTYETRDHRFMAVGALENRFWRNLCDHLALPHYADLQYDDARRSEIVTAFREVFMTKTMAQWENELAGLDICVSPVLNLDEALSSELSAARQMAVTVQGTDGRSQSAIGVPVKLAATPGTIRTPRADFGQDTNNIKKMYSSQ